MKIARQYYYLVSGLPDLFFDQTKLPFQVADFKEELRRQLPAEDFQQVEFLFLPFDNENLLGLLEKKDEAIDPLGNLSPGDWEEALRDPGRLLPYLQTFLTAYREQTPLAPNQSWENQLAALYYEYALEHACPFLKEYLAFERDLNNLLVAFSGRRHRLVTDGQLIGQYPLTEAVKQSHARDFGLSNDHPYLDKLLHLEDQPDVWDRERGIDRIRWNYIEELNTFHYFSLEVILGFMLQLMILKRWSSLDTERGRRILEVQLADLTQNLEMG